MDLWIEIKLGEKWIDDDRLIHEKVEIQQEVMLTSTREINKDLKKEFLKAVSKGFDRIMETYDFQKKYGI